jgi:hypothetical protein
MKFGARVLIIFVPGISCYIAAESSLRDVRNRQDMTRVLL